MSLTENDRKDRPIHGKTLHSERFSEAMALALHREFDETHAAIKTVMAFTGVKERTVRNWFDGKNGPSGESLITLCRHSDLVLETFLALAGRTDHIKARKIIHAKQKLRQILELVNELDG